MGLKKKKKKKTKRAVLVGGLFLAWEGKKGKGGARGVGRGDSVAWKAEGGWLPLAAQTSLENVLAPNADASRRRKGRSTVDNKLCT